MLRDMPMNGAKGRAGTLSRIRDRRVARAAAAGVDTRDRAAVERFDAAWSRATMQGISERARCRCGGAKHDRITGWAEEG